ncbi:FAD/NAD(P)-binding oxidoreductase [Halarcobacter sp.]|uniref:NAD(P)/FAD-dependent oxidoreductase n=1 Tax=Halarcobacter sp. TaxID=2321133 RepID=UPI002AA870E9|nr:FAD/NAD(P)-binding oxidoreductase [Halarcobacter sp.]
MVNNNELKKALDMLDSELKKKGISRRDALKLAGLGSASFLMGNGTEAQAATVANASEAKGKIVIVGGGLAGIATAAKLSSDLSNPDITVIEPNPISVSYQPGQTLVAAGIWEKSDIVYNTKDFVPNGVKMIKDKVAEFNPEANKVITEGGETISYDFLIVATGLVLDYGQIKGLEGVGHSAEANEKVSTIVGKNGLHSIYYADGAVNTWKGMQELISEAKSGKKLKALYTHPNTPIKCGGAPKKIMYLTNARLHEAGVRDNVDMWFYPNGSKMFGVPEYHEAIVKQFEARNMNWEYKNNLIEVDTENKIATFEKRWFEKGEWDEDLEEYEMIPVSKKVQREYDFMHVTPPMRAPDAVKNSSLAWQRGSASKGGWVELNKETLQHTRYPNVFGIGDVAGIPMGKTGGSARKQYKVLAENLIAAMEGKELASKYAGYTVCPLITDIGKVMLAEFDWSKKPTPSFPLDPTQERYIWWLLKVYLLKPMTVYGMLSGKA